MQAYTSSQLKMRAAIQDIDSAEKPCPSTCNIHEGSILTRVSGVEADLNSVRDAQLAKKRSCATRRALGEA
jgi:hypothetical protein